MHCTPLPPSPDPVRAALAACPALAALPPARRRHHRGAGLAAHAVDGRGGVPGGRPRRRDVRRRLGPDRRPAQLARRRRGRHGGRARRNAVRLPRAPRRGCRGRRTRSPSFRAGWSSSGPSSPHAPVHVLPRSWCSPSPATWPGSSARARGAVHEHAFYPAQARLARFLLAAAEPDGRIRLEGPQVLLAQRLGVDPADVEQGAAPPGDRRAGAGRPERTGRHDPRPAGSRRGDRTRTRAAEVAPRRRAAQTTENPAAGRAGRSAPRAARDPGRKVCTHRSLFTRAWRERHPAHRWSGRWPGPAG